jgi:hypothetical protein
LHTKKCLLKNKYKKSSHTYTQTTQKTTKTKPTQQQNIHFYGKNTQKTPKKHLPKKAYTKTPGYSKMSNQQQQKPGPYFETCSIPKNQQKQKRSPKNPLKQKISHSKRLRTNNRKNPDTQTLFLTFFGYLVNKSASNKSYSHPGIMTKKCIFQQKTQTTPWTKYTNLCQKRFKYHKQPNANNHKKHLKHKNNPKNSPKKQPNNNI